MAIGLAFVDIVGDTSRTEQQVERDMNLVLAEVERDIDPVAIQAAVAQGTEQSLTRELNQDIRASQQAIQAIELDARLSPETRAELTRNLRQAVQRARVAAGEIELRVSQRNMIREAIEGAQEAARAAEAAAPAIELETRVDRDLLGRVASGLRGVGSAAQTAAAPVALLSAGLAGFGAAVNAVAATVTALKAMAPAAAVAAPAVLSVVSAVGAVKLASVGIEDAVKAAFDPSKPDDFAKAVKNLAPEARKFVTALRDARPSLVEFQRSVQNQVFEGFAGALKTLSSDVLPDLKANVLTSAAVLNKMALSAVTAASELGKNGTLGTALQGASQGLTNLSGIPAQVVTAFGQISAAAAPAFERVTSKVAESVTKISTKLNDAFSAGRLTPAIDAAVAQIGALIDVIKNLNTIFGNIAKGGGEATSIITILAKVTGELAKATATDTAQKFFKALFDTITVLSDTALPLLSSALSAVAGALTAMAPGVQALIKALGPALQKVIDGLAPGLEALGRAASAGAIAFAPLITAAGTLVASVLPVLVPWFDALAQIFNAMAPVLAEVAGTVASGLAPILTSLATNALPPLIAALTTIITNLLPVFSRLLQAVQPALGTLSGAVVQLTTALGPLFAALGQLVSQALAVLLPFLEPIIDAVGVLAELFADELASFITNIVVPALQTLTALLSGDVNQALSSAKDLIKGFVIEVIQLFIELPLKIAGALFSLGINLIKAFGNAFLDLHRALINHADDIVNFFKSLPGRFVEAIGDLGRLLFNIGGDLIDGLIAGIKSKIGQLTNLLGSITDTIKEHKGPESVDRVLLTPVGQLIMDGLITGIASRVPALQSQLRGITAMVGGTGMALPGVSGGVGGRVAMPSAASQFASRTGVAAVTGTAAPNVQVFIGEQELTSIVDVRVAASNARNGRQINNGMRR